MLYSRTMHLSRFVSLLILVATLAGCAGAGFGPTRYEAMKGDAYGYDDMPLGGGVYRIAFSGNSNTPAELVDRFVLYRAAQITLAAGGKRFLVVDDKGQQSVSTYSGSSMITGTDVTRTPSAGRLFPGSTTVSTSTDASTYYGTSTEHSVIKTIRVLGPADSISGGIVYDAALIDSTRQAYVRQDSTEFGDSSPAEQGGHPALWVIGGLALLLFLFAVGH